MFMQHGAQKLLGSFGGINGNSAQLFSMFGIAGIIELFGGAFILIGLFTRFTALVSAIEMASAYFIVHASNGIFPITNGGELAILYFASFLILLAYGAGKWSLDNILFKTKKRK